MLVAATAREWSLTWTESEWGTSRDEEDGRLEERVAVIKCRRNESEDYSSKTRVVENKNYY